MKAAFVAVLASCLAGCALHQSVESGGEECSSTLGDNRLLSWPEWQAHSMAARLTYRAVGIVWDSRWGYSDGSETTDEFTAWDSRGRPLSGTRSNPAGDLDITFTYDDATRPKTEQIDSRDFVIQEDEFGNIMRDGSLAYTVPQMSEVCL